MHIVPKCRSKHLSRIAFVSADGYVFPCCFLNPNEIRSQFSKWLKKKGASIDDFKYNSSMDAVEARPGWQMLNASFADYDEAPRECRIKCGGHLIESNDNVAFWMVVDHYDNMEDDR